MKQQIVSSYIHLGIDVHGGLTLTTKQADTRNDMQVVVFRYYQ